MIILFWDIDSTLLTTGRAGILAWEDACREVIGHDLVFASLETDGLTDHQVGLRIIGQAGHSMQGDELERMVRVYESRLPDRLHARKGRVLDNVRECLDYFRAHRPEVHSMLLTGNTEAGAHAKLAHYGLLEYFEGGAFSADSGPRSAIAARALAAAHERFPAAGISADDVFVIGDTPHDIACAQAIGARAIAVATGVYTADRLAAHQPWLVVEQVPPPHELLAAIERPRRNER